MIAVTGITGQVGGVVARLLLAAGLEVRAVVRDAAKGEVWAKQGCEVALADVNDQQALQHAFEGTEGVFVLLPPTFDPTPGFPEARKTIATLRAALAAAKPSRVVVLSTIGAQATQPNLLNQLQILEQELGTLPMPVAFLRAAWFIENAAWDVTPARESGIVPSFLQPLDKLVPMVATADIGRVAAELLRESWTGHRIVELEGPQRISPDKIAESFARLLGRDVSMTIVPRDTWEDLFRSQGMKNPTPRMQMIDGFNEEWICFEGAENEVRKGRVPLDTVLQSLIERA
ncbi:NmrA family NAD(P)-binding protein [Caballeronia sordidicola]|uniref:NmrA family NAD(P)-binding protein n=1 Tax=Caballeronia sordidicola TaxID=196367 RepID=UPI0004CFF731|nr:NmrA family NAD(P)-binding protein [Caballeronia sordidicola]